MTAVVDIWWLDLDALHRAGASTAALPDPQERRRARLAANPRAGQRFAAGRLALRTLLAQRTGATAADISFRIEDSGRPVLAAGPPPWFSLSRSGALGVVAVADRPVGVDLDRLDQLDDGDDALCDAVTAETIATLRTLTPDRRRRAAGAAWTAHEAIVKATGTTLARAPRSTIDFDRPGTPRSGRNGGREWALHGLAAPPGYVATLAVEAPVRVVAHGVLRDLSDCDALGFRAASSQDDAEGRNRPMPTPRGRIRRA